MTIKEKIMKVLEAKGIAKEKFFEKIGMSSANFRGNAANTPLNSDAIANIFREIPDLDLEWLLIGKEPMFEGGVQFSIDTSAKPDPTEDIIPFQADLHLKQEEIAKQASKSSPSEISWLEKAAILLEKDNRRLNKENENLKAEIKRLRAKISSGSNKRADIGASAALPNKASNKSHKPAGSRSFQR